MNHSEWKCSNAIPIYNKEEPTCKTNDRPINLLSVIPNLFEKVQSVTPGVFSCFL
jgi:hypothetical protein